MTDGWISRFFHVTDWQISWFCTDHQLSAIYFWPIGEFTFFSCLTEKLCDFYPRFTDEFPTFFGTIEKFCNIFPWPINEFHNYYFIFFWTNWTCEKIMKVFSGGQLWNFAIFPWPIVEFRIFIVQQIDKNHMFPVSDWKDFEILIVTDWWISWYFSCDRMMKFTIFFLATEGQISQIFSYDWLSNLVLLFAAGRWISRFHPATEWRHFSAHFLLKKNAIFTHNRLTNFKIFIPRLNSQIYVFYPATKDNFCDFFPATDC